MSDYWYTDEYGRKRHVGRDSSEGYSVVPKHNYYAINSIFSSYSSHFSRSRLHSTQCPVCSADVFFCECDNGGRVFFDSLAPTWKKHPCTTNYESGNRVKTYHLIHPNENHFIKNGEYTYKKTVMKVPDFMDGFELNLNNSRAYANLIDNCTVMVRQHNGKLILTIIVNNKKFKNEYLCNEKEFSNQRKLEEFLESVLWNTDLAVSMKINKKENTIKSNGDHKIIQISKQNTSKVLTTLGERKRKEKQLQKKEMERRKQRYEEYVNKLYASDAAVDPDSKEKQFIPKREGFTIVKKKNGPTTVTLPIVPTAPAKKISPKMSLDQFGSMSEALAAIKNKLQKQMDENNG